MNLPQNVQLNYSGVDHSKSTSWHRKRNEDSNDTQIIRHHQNDDLLSEIAAKT